MVSKSKIKFIKSLQVKKYRKQEQSFVVEGAKSVSELLRSDFEIVWLAATQDFLDENSDVLKFDRFEIVKAKEDDLVQLGSFQSNE